MKRTLVILALALLGCDSPTRPLCLPKRMEVVVRGMDTRPAVELQKLGWNCRGIWSSQIGADFWQGMECTQCYGTNGSYRTPLPPVVP